MREFFIFISKAMFSYFCPIGKNLVLFLSDRDKFNDFMPDREKFSDFLPNRKKFSDFLPNRKKFSDFSPIGKNLAIFDIFIKKLV
jgi:hypothetical protein